MNMFGTDYNMSSYLTTMASLAVMDELMGPNPKRNATKKQAAHTPSWIGKLRMPKVSTGVARMFRLSFGQS